MAQRKELPVEEIVKQWKSGISQEKLADIYHVSRDTISCRIREYEVQNGEELPRAKPRKNLPMEQIVAERENGASYKQLADKYSVARETIMDRIKKYCEENGKKINTVVIKRNRKIKELPMDEIIKDWKDGFTYEELRDKYSASRTVIITRIREYKQKTGDKRVITSTMRKKWRANRKITNKNSIKPKSEAKLPDKIRMATIWKEYTDGFGVANLALKYRMTEGEIKTRLEQYQSLLLAKSYIDLNKSIAELARETELPILEVKEKIKTVLRKMVKTVPPAWYLSQRSKGYTEEQVLRIYLQQQKQKNKENVGEER